MRMLVGTTLVQAGLLQSIISNSIERRASLPPSSHRRSGARTVGPVRASAMRIGIGPFTTRTASHNRGLGRYVRSLISALVSRDHDNSYVLYCPDRLIADQLPTARNAEIHLLRRDAARGEANLTDALTRVITTNPDAMDVFLLLDAPALASSYCLPSQPASGLKVAALIHDLLPLLFADDSSPGQAEAERLRREVESLDRLGRYDALLAPSEAVRDGLCSVVRGDPDRVVTIGLAADRSILFPGQAAPTHPPLRKHFSKNWESQARSSSPWVRWNTSAAITCGD